MSMRHAAVDIGRRITLFALRCPDASDTVTMMRRRWLPSRLLYADAAFMPSLMPMPPHAISSLMPLLIRAAPDAAAALPLYAMAAVAAAFADFAAAILIFAMLLRYFY